MKISLEEAIDREFSCYYVADELTFEEEDIPCMAHDSARHFVHHVEGNDLPRLISLLKDIASNQEHSMVKFLEDKTWIEWTESDEMWRFFQKLVNAMSAQLQNFK